MTCSGIKVIRKDNVDYPVYLGREFMASDLTALNLSVRSYNGLRRAGWKTVEDIINHIESDQDLGKIRNLGKTSIQEILTKLFEYNRSLQSPGEIETYDKHVDFMQDIPAGEYSRLKRIYIDAGISIKEPHVGELSFPVNIEIADADVENLELSTRSYNALKRMGISKIKDIPHTYELRKIRSLGDNSIFEIIDKIFEYNYRRMEPSRRYEYLMAVKRHYEA